MANFAANGVICIGTDIAEATVKTINKGRIPVPNMEYWLGLDVGPLVKSGVMRATSNLKELLRDDVGVHMIAVPTEKGEKPWDGALRDVTEKIAAFDTRRRSHPPLVIIESTITPNKTDELVIPTLERNGLRVGKDVLVGVAPRRDWFISPDKNLRNLPRVIGGTTKETTEMMMNVLSIVCDKLLPASDHRHAEMVKSIENAFRHVEITLANQLSLAYPNVNMTEVLRLVGSKWNIGTYHPSFGSGGYCIPLSSHYVLQGTKNPEYLSILKDAIATDSMLPELLALSMVKRKAENVGVLGLSYKGDLKVHILSPTLKIVRKLKEKGVHVKVHDPYYAKEEIRQIVGTETFQFPSGLSEFDTILVVAGHRLYRATPEPKILDCLKRCRLVIDNLEETWKHIDFASRKIEYHIAGDPGWITKPMDD